MTGKGIVVVGTQFGDEGKGKIVDFYASKSTISAVVRFNGGANAGHTIVADGIKYALHLLPSGMVFEKPSFIGNGVVLEFEQLERELQDVHDKKKKDISSLLHISERTTLVLPFHKQLDQFQESLKKKLSKDAGTTKRGIGPAYSDKANRVSIRFIDLFDENHLQAALDVMNDYYAYFTDEVGISLSKQDLLTQLHRYKELYASMLTDVGYEVEKLFLEGKNILFEGAQSTLLDIDQGIYPFNTSSITVVSGASSGTGVGPQHLTERIGVVKAFTSRVGGGPVMGELDYTQGDGKLIQTEGAEFGTTTGRPRRIAWLDLVAIKYAIRINGLTGLAITKVDILGILPECKVIVGYKEKISGKIIESQFPAQLSKFESCEPIYKTFKGWGKKTEDEWKEIIKQGYGSFPKELREFIEFIEKETKVQAYIIGLGQSRDLTFEKIKII